MIQENQRKSIYISYFIWAIIIVITLYLLNNYGIESIRKSIVSSSPWTPIGIFLLRTLSIIIPALPSTGYSLLAGALLGFKKGILLICMADLFSCSVSFWISRKFGRSVVKRLVGNNFMGRVENISKKHIENNIFLMIGFLMTGLFDFVCYGIGLTKTPWSKFYPALLIGIVLSNPPIVALGAGILDGGKKILIFAALGILALAAISSKLSLSRRI